MIMKKYLRSQILYKSHEPVKKRRLYFVHTSQVTEIVQQIP